MALISAVGTPKAEQVMQPVAHHGVHAFRPGGRTHDRNVDDGGVQGVKGRVAEPNSMDYRRGFNPNLPPRMQSRGLPVYHGFQQSQWNTAPSAPTMAPLRPPAVCGATPNVVQRPTPLRVMGEREFKPFGIDAYPTHAQKPEICKDFTSTTKCCPHDSKCFRVHPKDRSRYARLTSERKTALISGLLDPPAPVVVVEATASSTPDITIDSDIQQKALSPASGHKASAWDPVTGFWNFYAHQEAWSPDDSSSSEGSVASSPDRSRPLVSCHSSDTEEDVNDAHGKTTLTVTLQRELCRNFQKGACNWGSRCRFRHTAEEEKIAPVQENHHIDKPFEPPITVSASLSSGGQSSSDAPPPTCLLWLKGRCWRGKTCRFHHPDINTVSPSDSSQVSSHPATAQSEQRFQRPPFQETCWLWLRGDCQKEHLCNYVHGNLTYDETKPPRQLVQVPARTVPEVLSTVIYKHIKIQVTEGFEIVDVVTGFETSWIYIGNVPRRVHHTQLAELLKSHGELVDLRTPEDAAGPFVVVKARFVNAAEASKVCSMVDGVEAFGSILSARLSISVNDEARTRLNDTSVRIQWEAPAKTAYAGFSTKASSDNAIAKCRSNALGKHLLKAAVHSGIPAVGRFNLRVDAVPAEVETDGLKDFLGADSVMWGQTNYASEVKALNGIQKMLKESGIDVLEFSVMPPPFKGGMVVAWAHLGTAGEAKKLCDYMHARKPHFTGHTRIFARHVQSLEYSLPREVYDNARKDIDALAASAWRMGHLSVACRIQPTSVLVRLGADNTQALSKLKTELDVILSGEVVRENGKVVWDRFFTQLGGLQFVADLQRQYSPLAIQVDKIRKRIRLFGASTARLAVRMKIMKRVEELRKQSVRTIPLDSRMLGAFMNDGLPQLRKEVGDDTVQLDLWNRSLLVRGDQHVQNAVRDAVIRTRRGLSTKRLPAVVECPICFEEASAPVTLCCGHSWCKTCIIRYMITAVDQKVFPLTCLGNDAKCKEKIPLSCGKQLLPPADFEALIEASFSAYVHKNLQEFAYCPTPDCQQIYRRLPRVVVPRQPSKSSRSANPISSPAVSSPISVGTMLQCPSCLVRICASCQTEAHDGLDCVRPDDGDGLFEEWMKNNDVKPCPGCKMPIEKAMGCHHVTCAVCSIHLCWVCLAPFHNGAGVYGHMLAAHGSFV